MLLNISCYNKKGYIIIYIERITVMVTINDIAKKAGVAKSTVSRYLNNGSVSEKTRKKIEKVIIETNYKPNTFARSLKAEKTNMIGVIIPRLNSPATIDVLEGIDKIAYEKGYQLIITNSDQNQKRELENIQSLAKQKVEGIIMLTTILTPEHNKLIQNLEIPFLSIGQKIEQVHSIIHDEEHAGEEIAKYALKLGHKDFLYVGVTEEDEAVGVKRKNSFLSYMDKQNDVKVDVVITGFSRKKAYKQAKKILPETKATYIVCATDNIAIGFLKAAETLNYSIPHDFSLSGFGGYDAADLVTPSLTTIYYPYKDLGKKALKTIDLLIKKEDVPLVQTISNKLLSKKSTSNK